MRLLRNLLALLCTIAIAALVYAGTDKGDESLGKILDGNKRFISGAFANKELGESRRKALAKEQHPFAIVLSCADSRVPPELIFDQGLGDIFVVRVAGNVLEPTTLGSIEYGAEHLHAPLLVILGHEQCGAVKATLDSTGEPEGNIGAILKKIMPAVQKAKAAKKDKDSTIDLAIQENIRNTYKDLMKSRIISELVHHNELKIVAAEYYLSSGKVEMIDLGEQKAAHTH